MAHCVERKHSFLIPIHLLILLVQCENYQTDGRWELADLDRRACELLFDTLSVETSTTVVSELQASWVEATDSLIGTLYDTLTLNTTIDVDYPGAPGDTSYAFFANAVADEQQAEVLFAFNDFLKIDLVKKDGTVIAYKSDAIPLETLAECYGMKTRTVFELGKGNYLVRLVINDATQYRPLRAAILSEL